jgi:hypothetical protein
MPWSRFAFSLLEVSDRGTDRPSSSYTHIPRLSILSHHPTLNLRTKISLPRPPRCIIVTHKVYTYAGLFIKRILIEHIEPLLGADVIFQKYSLMEYDTRSQQIMP